MSIAEQLGQFPVFSHARPDALKRIAPCFSRESFSADAKILRYGEESQDVYVICQGCVRIERTTPYGVFVLATLEKGDLFGETSFIDRGVRTTDAVATEEVEVLALSPLALNAAATDDLQLQVIMYWAFWKSLSEKLRRTNERLTRFFSESGKPPEAPSRETSTSVDELRIDLSAKRQLFLEQKLSNMEIHFLASLSKEQGFGPGETIFREGAAGDTMFVVLDGKVMISKEIPGAGEEALAFLERGDYFGEMALIDNTTRSADAKAHDGGAVVLAIPREVLSGILDIEKVSSVRLLTILCSLIARRLRELDEKIIGWYILAGGGQLEE